MPCCQDLALQYLANCDNADSSKLGSLISFLSTANLCTSTNCMSFPEAAASPAQCLSATYAYGQGICQGTSLTMKVCAQSQDAATTYLQASAPSKAYPQLGLSTLSRCEVLLGQACSAMGSTVSFEGVAFLRTYTSR